MTVNGNTPSLYRQVKELPWQAAPSVSSVTTGHGRRAHRTIKGAQAPAWIGFAGAARLDKNVSYPWMWSRVRGYHPAARDHRAEPGRAR
jgi:hypothetical protein